jgi:benzoyl-CoA reductase subunit D
MTVSIGIDVGSGAVKTALFRVKDGHTEWASRWDARILRRDPFQLAEESVSSVLDQAGLSRGDVDYTATTGEGENYREATGHFYSMTTHARGALYLSPDARAVLDVGALHGRAIRMDERGKVLRHRMTDQCASGSGQFLENIARHLGVAQDEIGPLSLRAAKPEPVSNICAVLAETDVINMVSRSVAPGDILRGIHDAMAERLTTLLQSIDVTDGVVMMTGGLARDTGLLQALADAMERRGMAARIATHPDSLYAGAIGAALWGAYRHIRLKEQGRPPKASHG